MSRRRDADVDDVDVRRGDQLSGVGRDELGAGDVRERAGALLVEVADGGVANVEQFAADDVADGGGVKAADEPAADEADAEGRHAL